MEAQGEEIGLRLLRRESPIELLELARLGGEAETVQRVMGEVLTREVDMLLSHLATMKPDAMGYSKLAGQAQVLLKIKKSLELQTADGKDAAANLRR